MHEKNMGSRSRAYRLNVEQLERRSMLTGDAEEVFFDWSQFDAAEPFDPWLDAWAAFNDAGGQPWDTDPTWFFGEGLEEQWPAESESSLPEVVTEDVVSEDAVENAPADAWSTADSQLDDEQVDEEQVTDEVGVYAPEEEVDSPSTTAADAGDPGSVEDTTAPAPEQDMELPIETEAVTVELPLSADEPDAEIPPEEFTGEEFTGEEFTGDGYEETLDPVDHGFELETGSEITTDAWGNLPEETFAAGEDAGDLPEDGADLDELLPSAGDEGVSEETSSLPEDLSSLPVPAPTSVPSALPRAVSAPRSAVFAAMRMFGGFSFMPQPDDASDGPIFAGGRRRPRR